MGTVATVCCSIAATDATTKVATDATITVDWRAATTGDCLTTGPTGTGAANCTANAVTGTVGIGAGTIGTLAAGTEGANGAGTPASPGAGVGTIAFICAGAGAGIPAGTPANAGVGTAAVYIAIMYDSNIAAQRAPRAGSAIVRASVYGVRHHRRQQSYLREF